MRKVSMIAVVLTAAAALLVQAGAGVSTPGRGSNPALAYALSVQNGGAVQRLPNGAPVPMISGAVASSAQELTSGAAAAPVSAPVISPSSNGCQNVYSAPGFPKNIRANQDCSLRRQAEEQVLVNPTDPMNLVVGQNDSVVGFNQTGTDYTTDGGMHWGSSPIPTRFLSCDGFGLDAFSDPAGAFDQSGNYFYTAVGFDINAATSGIYVWTANADAKGSFLRSPAGGDFSATPTVVYDNCANLDLSPDKELMAADSHPGSPFAGNVYVTFTLFDFTGGIYDQSPIYFSSSSDGGMTFSPAIEISGNNPDICVGGDTFNPGLDPADCNFDQGSYPVIGPDGSINVVYNNCNTPPGAPFAGFFCQQLFVKSTDGGATWSTPVRVAKDVATQPFNDAGELGNGCNIGRQCLPPNGYRMNDFPSMGIDENTGVLGVFWADFRNGCNAGDGFCSGTDNSNNDVFVAASADGGATWGPTRLVSKSPMGGSDPAAQWQPWGDVGENGKFTVAYYDRRNGDCEVSGCNDITLATSKNLNTWTYKTITTSSMPNLTPTNNAFQAGFLGDYMWTQWANGKVYIVWADTRGLQGTVEEDIYYAAVPG
jgi:hypothetical protein